MKWRVEFTKAAAKDFRRLSADARIRILNFLENRASVLDDPRVLAKQLAGPDENRWRFRVGPYRILFRFEGQSLVILVLAIAHRRKVYR